MIGVGVQLGGHALNLTITSPREHQTDSACAAQDETSETISQGEVHASRSALDDLLAKPGPLDRFQTDNR